jgi:hypothetical protein
MLMPDNLPYHGKRIYKKVYNRSLQLYKSEQIANQLACYAVKKKYINKNGVWHTRVNANDTDTTTDNSSNTSSVTSDPSDTTTDSE